MTQTAELTVRARRAPRAMPRAIDTDDTHEQTPAEQAQELIEQFVAANKAKNEAARQEREAHKALHTLMARTGFSDLRTDVDGQVYEAKIAPSEKVEIDVARLRDLVDDTLFMQIVKATQTDVKNKCGSNVLAQVSNTKQTDPKLTVKAVKN